MGGHRNDSNERQHVADRDRTPERGAKADRPPRTLGEQDAPERYPSVRRDDSVEAADDGEGD